MKNVSFIMQAHPEYIDSLYKEYLKNPDSVDKEWQIFFKGYELANESPSSLKDDSRVLKEIKVINLIQEYRRRGHFFTKTNPVRERRKYSPTLDIKNFGFSEADLETTFEAGTEIGIGKATLKEIVSHLETTYCHSIGAECAFIRHPENIKWLQHKMESVKNTPDFSKEEKKNILTKLMEAVVFEDFLHTKYIGQKRFSLSGVEAIIPGLDTVIHKGAELGIIECVIGMAHRGRLNVLTSTLQKDYAEIFMEFEGKASVDEVFAGDVKYHLGFSNDVTAKNGKNIHLNILANPSHLEAINPIVEGSVRAKIDKRYEGDINKIVPILIHGDAAIAGQGVVYEVSQMSKLPGYQTGGTVHFVLNNQIGFTTNYIEGRSSTYCTDIAKVTLSPVFHVNADDAEAVAFAVQIAMEYRQTFHTDVYIDLLGYRRYGHNEADEPRFTQPKLYDAIAKHENPYLIYSKKLVAEGSFTKEEIDDLEKSYRQKLQDCLDMVRGEGFNTKDYSLKGDWTGFRRATKEDFYNSPETKVDLKKLKEIGTNVLTLPEDFKIMPKMRRIYENEKKLFLQENKSDWTIGEYLAYGSLLVEGYSVRLSGQDCKRGTFAHRHSVILKEDTEEEYIPLNNISPNQAKFQVWNSPLSEYGVMGFEYGYSSANPKTLTIWEAQFGDFVNGAQIIIDQFLCAAETKWKRNNGLVLFLPHGHEGQGPEHTSGRMERFLTLCAHNNMQVLNCTTPANFFHALRRHMKFEFRIPLIVFTPKSTLRHPLCQSPIEDFANGKFQLTIDDNYVKPTNVKKIVFCTGKIYYDLFQYQQEHKCEEVAVVRLEQIYPFPERELEALIQKYNKAKKYVWVQEEPENMGAWTYIMRKWKLNNLQVISRIAHGAPATGSYKQHVAEQKEIVQQAFE